MYRYNIELSRGRKLFSRHGIATASRSIAGYQEGFFAVQGNIRRPHNHHPDKSSHGLSVHGSEKGGLSGGSTGAVTILSVHILPD